MEGGIDLSNGEEGSGDEADLHDDLEVEMFEKQMMLLEGKLTDIQSFLQVGGVVDEARGINIDRHLLKLKDLREELATSQTELHDLVDGPLRLLLDVEMPSPAVTVVHSKAEMSLLKTQDLSSDLEALIQETEEKIEGRNSKIIAELEVMEEWVNTAYSRVLMEPNRYRYPPYILDEEHLNSLSESSSLYSSSEGWASGRGSVSFEPRGGSIGGGGGGEGSRLDSRQDDFVEEESMMEDRGVRDGSEGVIDGFERVKDGSEEVKEGSEGVKEGLATLDSEEVNGHGLERVNDIIQGVNNALLKENGDTINTDDLIQGSSGAEGVIFSGDGVNEEAETEVDSSPSQSGTTLTSGGDSGELSQSLSQSQSEGSSNLDWVRDLRLIPLFHAPGLRRELLLRRGIVDDKDLEVLIGDLEKLSAELPIQSQMIKKVTAKVHFFMNSLSTESSASYAERLRLVNARWCVLEEELKLRLVKLNFEKEQKATLETIQEAMSELEHQPQANVLPDLVEEKYGDLMDFIISLDQFHSLRDQQLLSLEESLEALKGECPEAEEIKDWEDMVEQLKEAYGQIAKKIDEQKLFLEKCQEMWEKFKELNSHCEAWLERAELLVSKETYGYTLENVEAYLQEIKLLLATVPEEEGRGEALVSHGKHILTSVEEGSGADEYIDQRLMAVEQRWAELVTPHSGRIEEKERDVNKAIIDWRGYTGMLAGTRSFIDQISKMVGPEPMESSHGDVTLLPTYVAYANQIKQMGVQYNRLVTTGNILGQNQYLGCRDIFLEELKNISMQWGPVKDNVMDTLDLLIREYNEWIMMKLHHMNDIITQANDIVKNEISFIKTFPLDSILTEEAEELLREADTLVVHQDQLNQIETECTQIEEKLLEKQIQQETSLEFAAGLLGEIEYAGTSEERARLQGCRERIQGDAEGLLPVLNVLYLQLQLLQNIQDSSKLLSKAVEFVGDLPQCERLLVEVELVCSEDYFEKLNSQAYDLGAVMEEVQETMGGMEEKGNLSSIIPPPSKLVAVNKALVSEIKNLSASTEQAKLRLHLFIQWWEEFHINRDDILPWLKGMETRISQMMTRFISTLPPRVSPSDMLQELKELSGQVEEKSIVVCALELTGQNILEEMILKSVPPGPIPDLLASIKARWEGLRGKIASLLFDIESSSKEFDSFVSRLTGLVSWLSEFHGRLYDEVCIRMPQKAPEELVSRHKNELEVFRAEVQTRVGEYQWVKGRAEVWGEYLVPEEALSNLPSPSEASPVPEDDSEFPPASLLPYIKGRVKSMTRVWSTVQRLLADRDLELELCTGSYQAFLEQAEVLMVWLRGKLGGEVLSGLPPADLEVVEGYQREIELTKEECFGRLAALNALEHMATSLREQGQPGSVEKVLRIMEEMKQLWGEMERGTEERVVVLCPLVINLREFEKDSSDLEVWLKEREAELEECGTIGANLDRCIEQTSILEQMDGVLLSHKVSTERNQEWASDLVAGCEAQSGARVLARVEERERRYVYLCEEVEERKEKCEEAISLLQVLMKKVKAFEEWLGKMEEALKKRKKEKRPIGTLQTELEEHYDFMRDVESHNDEYSVLVPEGRGLMKEYQPDDWLGGIMQALHDRWFGFIDTQVDRCRELSALITCWERYEKDVKDLLGWIMSEADGFSKDVTTPGDKGVIDHMETCKNFMTTLEGKSVTIEAITDQANLLKANDGEKKNGTSDVESRWNDVQMHWNSSCKLLRETLLHLEATEAEMRHVLQIRGEEFEWLEVTEFHANARQQTRGDLEILDKEIEKHEFLLQDALSHEERCVFISATVPYLVEHSRKADREEMKLKAEEFTSRHKNLVESETRHVSMLKESIPFWKRFNSNVKDLSSWLTQVSSDLGSENVKFGNARVTERSLVFCRDLQSDIHAHNPQLLDLTQLGEDLANYVVDGDQEFVREWLQRLAEGEKSISMETVDKTIRLEERLKSWSVFPVEEARVVQEFLEQVGEEVDIDDLPDDLTSEELLERLERLQTLQSMQNTNQDKVQTIHQSANSADVQKALEKNPDISKERNNLLLGWSNVSTSLQDKIFALKLKAKVTQVLEGEVEALEEEVGVYRSHLDTPLPPSVLLVEAHEDIERTEALLLTACQTSLGDLRNSLRRYDTDDEFAGVKVPQHFIDKADQFSEQFDELSIRGQERTNQIASTLSSWEEFRTGIDELVGWVRSYSMELESLKVMEEFAMDFSAHQTRLHMLSEGIKEQDPAFSTMVDSSPLHITGDEPEVQNILRKFTSLKRSWNHLQESIEELSRASEPWVKLTDLFDELSYWLGDLERQVEEEEDTIATIDDEEGGDLSDKIVNFKDYLKRISHKRSNFAELERDVAEILSKEVCDNHESCDQLRKESADLTERWEELERRLQVGTEDLIEKEAHWKLYATESIRKVRTLKNDILSYEDRLADRDAQIAELMVAASRSRPSSPQFPGRHAIVAMVVVGVAAVLLYFGIQHRSAPPLP